MEKQNLKLVESNFIDDEKVYLEFYNGLEIVENYLEKQKYNNEWYFKINKNEWEKLKTKLLNNFNFKDEILFELQKYREFISIGWNWILIGSGDLRYVFEF